VFYPTWPTPGSAGCLTGPTPGFPGCWPSTRSGSTCVALRAARGASSAAVLVAWARRGAVGAGGRQAVGCAVLLVAGAPLRACTALALQHLRAHASPQASPQGAAAEPQREQIQQSLRVRKGAMDSRGEQGGGEQAGLSTPPSRATTTGRQGLADDTKGGTWTKLAANTQGSQIRNPRRLSSRAARPSPGRVVAAEQHRL
jgi:hypothetical protein